MSRTQHPISELQDLLGKHIDGQFYAEELIPVLVTKNTTSAIDKNCQIDSDEAF